MLISTIKANELQAIWKTKNIQHNISSRILWEIFLQLYWSDKLTNRHHKILLYFECRQSKVNRVHILALCSIPVAMNIQLVDGKAIKSAIFSNDNNNKSTSSFTFDWAFFVCVSIFILLHFVCCVILFFMLSGAEYIFGERGCDNASILCEMLSYKKKH